MTIAEDTKVAGPATQPVPADWLGTAATPIGVDEAFNGYIAANVVFALDRLGVWERLDREPGVALDVLAAAAGSDERLLDQLLQTAATFGYLTYRGLRATLTGAGREMFAMRGYFTWAVGGYQELFGNACALATGARRFRRDIQRDEEMVALGSGLNDKAFLAGLLDQVLADVDFHAIADLGSGGANRICRVVGAREDARGLGLDISAGATRLAEETIRGAGLDDRVRAVRTDVLDVVLRREHRGALAEIDAVMSFFLMHDLLADPATRHEVLPKMREAFPNARTFLLADTMLRPEQDAGATLPVFSTGYELAHSLMGIPLHTKETYEELFAEAGLTVQRAQPFGTPHSWLYVAHTD